MRVHADVCCTCHLLSVPLTFTHVLHRGAVMSLVGIWEMMVVAGELEEKCVSFEQYLATQVPQSRGNVVKSLTTVSCMSESVLGEAAQRIKLPFLLLNNPPSFLSFYSSLSSSLFLSPSSSFLSSSTGHSSDRYAQKDIPRG